MKCPRCKCRRLRTLHTFPKRHPLRRYRIRECLECSARFRTYEQLDPNDPNSGRRPHEQRMNPEAGRKPKPRRPSESPKPRPIPEEPAELRDDLEQLEDLEAPDQVERRKAAEQLAGDLPKLPRVDS